MICFAGPSTMKLSPASAFLSVVFVSFLSMRLLAQVAPGVQEIDRTRLNEQVATYETAPNTAVIIVHTFAEEKPVSLDRSARVDLTNLGNHLGVFLTVPGRDSAVFTNTALGTYTVSVTAVGYMSASQEISVLRPEKQDVEIVLHRDPGAVTLNEATGLLSRKAQKEANRAVSRLKSGDLTKAEKHLKTAYVSAPSNADLNFLLGYLYFQKNDYAQAGTYLGTAASLSPNSAQTLTLLGRTKLAVQNYPEAESALKQAILVDSEEWLAHDVLANAYLHQKEFGKALDEARVAVAKSARYGKDASATAELTLGQALIGVGQKNEGIQALRVFLDGSPPKNMIEPVHALITRAEESNQALAAGSEIITSPAPLMAVPKPVLSMQNWRPPDIDDIKPTLEPGVTCPCAQILAKTGQRVQELFQDITRFTAEENLFHKSLDGIGLSNQRRNKKVQLCRRNFVETGIGFDRGLYRRQSSSAWLSRRNRKYGLRNAGARFSSRDAGRFRFRLRGTRQVAWKTHLVSTLPPTSRPSKSHARLQFCWQDLSHRLEGESMDLFRHFSSRAY